MGFFPAGCIFLILRKPSRSMMPGVSSMIVHVPSASIFHCGNISTSRRVTRVFSKWVESWPRRVGLPSMIGFLKCPRRLEFSIFFFYHFGIGRFIMILRCWHDSTILETLKCFDEKWPSLFSGECKERSRRIRRGDVPCFLEENIPFIHSETICMIVRPVVASPFKRACWLVRLTNILEEEAWTFQKTHRRNIEQHLRQYFPICDDDTDIRSESMKSAWRKRKSSFFTFSGWKRVRFFSRASCVTGEAMTSCPRPPILSGLETTQIISRCCSCASK